jgi:hypothetical protein
MKIYGGMKVKLQALLMLALNGGKYSDPHSNHLDPRDRVSRGKASELVWVWRQTANSLPLMGIAFSLCSPYIASQFMHHNFKWVMLVHGIETQT